MTISASQKIKTGTFVVICLVLLLALIFLIGKQRNLFGTNFTVRANFKNIAGLREGNYVRFAGINIGIVDNINIVNDTTVQVTLSLQNRVRKHVKRDAVASIGSDGLMGDKLILIAPGDPNAPALERNGIVQTTNPVDVDKIMNNLTAISDNAEQVTGGLADIVERINNGEGTIGRLVANDRLAKKMETTIEEAKETAENVTKTAKSVNENMQAAKNSFLLRGYFKKKERKRVKDSIENAKKEQQAKAKQEEVKKN